MPPRRPRRAAATSPATEPQPSPNTWRSRITGEAEVSPAGLEVNPLNWRTHPSPQQRALAGALAQLGWVQRIVVNERTGHVVDGHLRLQLAQEHGETTVPVIYVDLDPAEERLALATLDPITGMAGVDAATLSALIGELKTDGLPEDHDLTAVISSLTPIGPDDLPPVLSDRFELAIECRDEPDMHHLYDRLAAEGRRCKTMALLLPSPVLRPEAPPFPLPGQVEIVLRSEVQETFRTARVRGMFDLPSSQAREFSLRIEADIDALPDWRIGVITGASGSGKSTLARRLFPQVIGPGDLAWSSDRAILDDFREDLPIEEITSALISVGFSSMPNWRCPYPVLSFGERFRADAARSICEASPAVPLVLDEFTSVVDRIVARICSLAVARTMRQRQTRFVAVTCHRDIIPWLQPDWVLDLDIRRLLHGGDIPPRPRIELRIYPAKHDAWAGFHRFHYLTADLSPAARCFVVSIRLEDIPGEERAAAFFAIVPAMGLKGWDRSHRLVVLPDFQGIGIGTRFQAEIGEWLWLAKRRRLRATGSGPALTSHRNRSPAWQLVAGAALNPRAAFAPSQRSRGFEVMNSAGRMTTSWIYLPKDIRP